jgi:hypothetical protein
MWIPGTSGGATAWLALVTDLLKKRMDRSPPAPYSFAASEVLGLLTFKLDLA